MKIKTSDLIGPALDWAVAVCQNVELDENNDPIWFDDRGWLVRYSPSTDWAYGGPIIEREGIQWCELNGRIEAGSGFNYIEWRQDWDSSICMGEGSGFGTGPTSLIAAMRCLVASKLGDEVEVPDELIRE